jgi:hypothetical protein
VQRLQLVEAPRHVAFPSLAGPAGSIVQVNWYTDY